MLKVEWTNRDALEVVRCKDCASWGNRVRSCDVGTGFNGKTDGNYLGDCIQFGTMTLPNFYCAWGERKEEHLTMPKADGSTIPKSYMDKVTNET